MKKQKKDEIVPASNVVLEQAAASISEREVEEELTDLDGYREAMRDINQGGCHLLSDEI